MKTIKGLLGYVGFGVSAIISQGQQSFSPLIQKSVETGRGGKDTMILLYTLHSSVLQWC